MIRVRVVDGGEAITIAKDSRTFNNTIRNWLDLPADSIVLLKDQNESLLTVGEAKAGESYLIEVRENTDKSTDVLKLKQLLSTGMNEESKAALDSLVKKNQPGCDPDGVLSNLLYLCLVDVAMFPQSAFRAVLAKQLNGEAESVFSSDIIRSSIMKVLEFTTNRKLINAFLVDLIMNDCLKPPIMQTVLSSFAPSSIATDFLIELYKRSPKRQVFPDGFVYSCYSSYKDALEIMDRYEFCPSIPFVYIRCLIDSLLRDNEGPDVIIKILSNLGESSLFTSKRIVKATIDPFIDYAYNTLFVTTKPYVTFAGDDYTKLVDFLTVYSSVLEYVYFERYTRQRDVLDRVYKRIKKASFQPKGLFYSFVSILVEEDVVVRSVLMDWMKDCGDHPEAVVELNAYLCS